eukprot:351773-Chlamydomonas_euryale.AAC.14
MRPAFSPPPAAASALSAMQRRHAASQRHPRCENHCAGGGARMPAACLVRTAAIHVGLAFGRCSAWQVSSRQGSRWRGGTHIRLQRPATLLHL